MPRQYLKNNVLRLTEKQESKLFWGWCKLHPICKEYMIKIPNEGKRSRWYGCELVQMGLSKGFPDYLLLYPSSRFHGLAIEMKTVEERNKRKRLEQVVWLQKLNNVKYFATFAYGFDEAEKITLEYLTS